MRRMLFSIISPTIQEQSVLKRKRRGDKISGEWLFQACIYFAILRHSSAQLRQACAHCLQWSISWRSHSLAQASQMSAHRLQNCFANWLSIDINAADVQQTAAHSLFI
jgi:hypothetical protein